MGNRDQDGQIVADGPRQRGPGGGRRRMQRRTQAQEEEPVQDVIDEPRVDGEIDSDDEGNPSKISGKLGKKKLLKMEEKAEKKKQREAELQERKKRLEKEEQERNLQEAKEQEQERKQLEEEQR